jgi:hypothetical protein
VTDIADHCAEPLGRCEYHERDKPVHYTEGTTT